MAEVLEGVVVTSPVTVTVDEAKVITSKRDAALAVAAEIKGFVDSVKRNFVNSDDEIEKILYALLCGEHLLFKGKPGVAKSTLVKAVVNNIVNSKVFIKQMAKDMTPDVLFGAIDFAKLKEHSVIEHNTKGSVVEADFVLLDEIFDAPDMLLRSLLEILNERTFSRNGDAFTQCPLHSAFLVSNFRRETEDTEAFLDRILFQKEIKPLTIARDRMRMMKNHLKGVNLVKATKQIELTQIKLAASYVANGVVNIPEEMLNYYDKMIVEYQRQSGKYVSPRKQNKMLSILKASALLNGRIEVELDDLNEIHHALVIGEDVKDREIFNSVRDKTLKDLKFAKEEQKIITDLEAEFLAIDTLALASKEQTIVGKIKKFGDLYNKIMGTAFNIETHQKAAGLLKDKAFNTQDALKRSLFQG